jgi:hypothetical protein
LKENALNETSVHTGDIIRPDDRSSAIDDPMDTGASVTRRGDEPRQPMSKCQKNKAGHFFDDEDMGRCIFCKQTQKPRQPKEHPGFMVIRLSLGHLEATKCKRCHCLVDELGIDEHAEVCHD